MESSASGHWRYFIPENLLCVIWKDLEVEWISIFRPSPITPAVLSASHIAAN
jgi:hypothetical protein